MWYALAVFVMLSGCGGLPKPVLIAPDTYAVPVIPTARGPEIAGHSESDRIATVVVPPSDKPTTVRVYRKKVSVIKRLLTNAPKVNAVSENPSVVVETPKNATWWRWLLLVGFFGAVLMWVTRRFFSIRPWAAPWRLISRHIVKRP